MKKYAETTKRCRDQYNKLNSTIQISKELVADLKSFLEGSQSLKDFIEEAIKEKMSKD